MTPPHQSRRQGSSLIIVLALLALLMALVLAALGTSRAHFRRDSLMADGIEADTLTRMPLDIVLAQIQQATTQPGVLWASQPGMIRTFENSPAADQARPAVKTHHRLYSAPVMNSAVFDAAGEMKVLAGWAAAPGRFTDLNQPAFTTRNGHVEAVHPIADPAMLGVVEGYALRSAAPGAGAAHPLPLPVAWLYVLEDGRLALPASEDKDGVHFDPAQVSRRNPVVARIAFWTDDESCKLNLNTASEPRPWSMPAANTLTERGHAAWPPEKAEFRADSSHPAFTSLSVVMKHFGGGHAGGVQWPVADPLDPLDAETSVWWRKHLACYQTLAPDGMLSPGIFKKERQYASVEDFYFAPDRTPNGLKVGFAMSQADLARTRFLLTTRSSAPELNPLGQPKMPLWTMSRDAAGRTPADLRLNACTAPDPARPLIFQRAADWAGNAAPGSSQSMEADWRDVPRNQEIFAWLRRMTEEPVPGFGLRLVDRHGAASRDHLLVSMLDMLRWTCNPSLPPSGATGANSAVPLTIAGGSNGRGFGRHPTFSEAALVIAFTDVERTGGRPRDDNQDGICDRATKMRAFFVVNPFTPAAGPPAFSPAWSLRVRRLQQWTIGKVGAQFPGGNVRTRARLSTQAAVNDGCATAFGNFAALFLKADGTPKEPGNRLDPENGYPFISQGDITLQASAGRPGGRLDFSGGRVILDVMPVDAPMGPPQANDAIHSVEIEFPPLDLPMPSLRVSDYQNGSRLLTTRFTPVQEGRIWRLPLIERGDIVRSVVLGVDGPSKGDARLIAARRELLFPEAAGWYRPHPDYFSTKPQAQSLRDGGHILEAQFGSTGDEGLPQPTRDTAGSLLPGMTYAANAIPAVPVAMTSAQRLDGSAGDWESGVGLLEDGAYIHRGPLQPQGGFSRGETPAAPGRPMPLTSAAAFGALPSGAFGDAQSAAPRPWETLRFYPGDGSRPSLDHLWLEFFHQPVIEPWPLTSHFTTEGRVNMNFQILPWAWLRRSTALHGAMQGVRLAAIPAEALSQGQTSAKGAVDGSPLDREFRYAVNAAATLDAFEQRFDAGEVFRSPSEICDLFLVPKRLSGHSYGSAPDPAKLTAAEMPRWWQGSPSGPADAFDATGDNLRESPYAQLHPRLCTQSNIFRVHYRVQVLKKARGTPEASFDEARDRVVAERRGSHLIARQFQPATTPVDPVTNPAAPSPQTQQRLIILAHEPFMP